MKRDIRRDMGHLGEGIRDLQAAAADTEHAMRRLLVAASTEITDCPRLFTVSRTRSGLATVKPHLHQYRLVLWCEHSGGWHPCDDAAYTFEQPAQWFQTISGYAGPFLAILAKAVSVAGGLAGVTLSGVALDRAKAELDLAKTLITELPTTEPDEDRWTDATADFHPPLLSGADLRSARNLLRKLDPASRFGGLHRLQAASGEYLWVCPSHALTYDPGLPTIEHPGGLGQVQGDVRTARAADHVPGS
jgi:internalin A